MNWISGISCEIFNGAGSHTIIIETITLAGALLTIVLIGAWTVRTGVPPLPTTPGVRHTIHGMLPRDVTGTIVDLGSGWGGLARMLARRYPDRPVIGYELSPIPFFVARIWQALIPQGNLQYHRVDFMSVDLSDVGLVACFLYPGAMATLEPKLARELCSGARVVSNFFALPRRQATETRTAPDLWSSPVYMYVYGDREGR